MPFARSFTASPGAHQIQFGHFANGSHGLRDDGAEMDGQRARANGWAARGGNPNGSSSSDDGGHCAIGVVLPLAFSISDRLIFCVSNFVGSEMGQDFQGPAHFLLTGHNESTGGKLHSPFA